MHLVTARLELRDFRREDLAAVQVYASHPDVVRYLWWGPFDHAQTLAFLERTAHEALAVPRRDYELAVVDRGLGQVIGGCELLVRRQQYREYEIGYCLRPDWWARGIGTEIVRALLELAFSSLDAHRVYGLVDPDNATSRRLLERIGFRLEGNLRRDSLIRGEWRDSMVYALLDEEWRESDAKD